MQISQTALIQRRIFEEAIELLGQTLEHMDKKIELKDIRRIFSTDKIGFSHEKALKQIEKTNLTESLTKQIDLKLY